MHLHGPVGCQTVDSTIITIDSGNQVYSQTVKNDYPRTVDSQLWENIDSIVGSI